MTGTDINKRVERFSNAAKAERRQSPEIIQKTKAVRFHKAAVNQLQKVICKEDAPTGTIIKARIEADEDAWYTGIEYHATSSIVSADIVSHSGTTEPIDYLYKCIKNHTSGGGDVWDPGIYAVGDRVSYDGDAYICIQKTVTLIDAPDVATDYWALDNDEPGEGNAWQTYWERQANLQIHCRLFLGGQNLDEVSPQLAKGDILFVQQFKNLSTDEYEWWSIDTFIPDKECVCEEPP